MRGGGYKAPFQENTLLPVDSLRDFFWTGQSNSHFDLAARSWNGAHDDRGTTLSLPVIALL